ncbi:DUF3710 domain-containing protein [Aquipuribacter sp. SD81]|uniref:DUF3710 domain-containing protein n=1 Tax=Aquipuribacter sp. SD81 TaxID=3127703 RepID=UPI0030172F25
MTPFWSRSTRPDPSLPDPSGTPTPVSPETGPFDSGDPAAPTTGLLDLGALRLPARPELKVRLDLDKATQRVAAVTVQAEASTVQVTVFAAPRSAGVWDDVRGEIAAAVQQGGGRAEEVTGTFGTELVARLPTRLPDGRDVLQVQRFCGVDGPRWFVRAVFTGPDVLQRAGATLPDEIATRARGDLLEEVVRTAVVVRGTEPMAPREPLPLRLPEGARRAPRRPEARAEPAAAAGTAAGTATGQPPEGPDASDAGQDGDPSDGTPEQS